MQKINIGDRFGRLVVLKETTKEERTNQAGRNYWCQCDCGNKIIVYGHNLKTGNTKSCGCLSRQLASERNTSDIPIGSVFKNLTVIDRAPIHSDGLAYWKCRCSCGKIVEVSGRYLRSGHTTSCGDNIHRTINEIGNKYGLLTVLSYSGHRDDGGAIWKCKCDCGKVVDVRGDSLRSGHTTSCGCLTSYVEKTISDLLQQNSLIFQTQYTFQDLRGTKNGILRFDFAILDKTRNLQCLIEYQGEQHYDPSNNWYSEEYVMRDKLKQEYCTKHNIQLYIWDKNTNLEKAIIELAKQYRGEE